MPAYLLVTVCLFYTIHRSYTIDYTLSSNLCSYIEVEQHSLTSSTAILHQTNINSPLVKGILHVSSPRMLP